MKRYTVAGFDTVMRLPGAFSIQPEKGSIKTSPDTCLKSFTLRVINGKPSMRALAAMIASGSLMAMVERISITHSTTAAVKTISSS